MRWEAGILRSALKPRPLILLVLLSLTLAACRGSTEVDAGVQGAAAPTTSAPLKTLDVLLVFVAYIKGGDGSGISRENNDEGTPCGTTGLTEPTDTLAFMRPTAEVLVRDGEKKLVGKGLVQGVGEATNIQEQPVSYTCTWRAYVDQLPDTAFYTVEVGRRVIGTFSRKEIPPTSVGWSAIPEVKIFLRT